MKSTILTSFEKHEIQTMIQESVEKSVQKLVSKQNCSNIELITINELINILIVSKMTIHNCRKKGILPSINIEGRVLFQLSEISEFINNYKAKQNSN